MGVHVHEGCDVLIAMDYADRTASADGNTIDRQGYGAVMFVPFTATTTTADASNYFTFTVEHGAASDLSDAVAATGDGNVKNNVAAIDLATQDDAELGYITYVGTQRYCRLVATETGTAQAAFAALAVLFPAESSPVTPTTS